MLAYFLVLLAVVGIASFHITAKYTFNRKPSLTSVDMLMFNGICISILFFIWAKLAKIPLLLTQLPLKPFMILVGCLVITIFRFCLVLKGLSLLSVGKSTMILSTNTIFTIILSAIVLSEPITALVVLASIGAFIGIFVFSFSGSGDLEKDESMIGGIFLVFFGTFLQSVGVVLVKMISSFKIHFVVRTFYLGVSFLLFAGIISSLYREGITFQTYDYTDTALMSVIGITT